MRAPAVSDVASLTDDRWDDALEDSGLPFRASHRSGLGRAFEAAFDSYRFRPLMVSYSDGTCLLVPTVEVNRALPGLAMRLAMPASLEGTPVAMRGRATAPHVGALFRALDDAGFLEISGGAGASPPSIGAVTRRTTHILELDQDFERVWMGRFSSKNRNMCRKAEKAGVTVGREHDAGSVGEYYQLYQESTREWGYAAPPYPETLFQSLVNSGVAELWLARAGSEVAAGALLLRGSEDLLYWSGAMSRTHRNMAPSNAVLRGAIQSACERGLSYFDFGESGPLAGVEAFKTSFGASPRDYIVSTLSTWRYEMGSRVVRAAARWRSR